MTVIYDVKSADRVFIENNNDDLIDAGLFATFAFAATFGPDVPAQIPIAANTNLPTDPVSMTQAGLLTFNQAGRYLVEAEIIVGRTTDTGFAFIHGWHKTNGIEPVRPNIVGILSSDLDFQEYSDIFTITAQVGTTLSWEIWCDSLGATEGILLNFTDTYSGQPMKSFNVKVSRLWSPNFS